MRFRKLDLNLLITLNILMDELSVTRAAERLHLSQPAVSSALAKLRQHFNDELLVSCGRTMRATPFAEAIREPLNSFLHIAHNLTEAAPGFDPMKSERRFSIVASDVVMMVLLGDVIRRLSVIAPNISLDILEPRAGHLHDDLENGEADVVIIPREYAAAKFQTETLYEDTYSCLVWTGNSVVGEKLTRDQYSQLRHVSMNFGRAQNSGLIGEVNARAGIRPRDAALIPFFSLSADMLVGTDYVAALPTRLARLKASTLPLRVVEPPISFPPIDEVMQWNSYQDRDPGLMWLREILREQAQEVCP